MSNRRFKVLRKKPGEAIYIKLPSVFNRYMKFMGFLGLVSSLLEGEVSQEERERFILQKIVLLLSIISEHCSRDILILNGIGISHKARFDTLINKLWKKKFITKTQFDYLDDFRNLRNELIHRNNPGKVLFRKKSVMTKQVIQELISEVLNIIVSVKSKSAKTVEIPYDIKKLIKQLNNLIKHINSN